MVVNPRHPVIIPKHSVRLLMSVHVLYLVHKAHPAPQAPKALQAAHVTMSERMSSVPLTGDPDRDFLAQMIPHHEGAIEMSKVLLKDGVRPEVRRLAQEIIAHQQGEIEMMRRWVEAISK